MKRRLTSALVTAALLAVALAAVLADAARRRSADETRASARHAVVEALGSADLALSSSSRWLRHPSLSEPAAAFADGAAVLDSDPAGALIGPPRDLYRIDARPITRTRDEPAASRGGPQ